MNILSLPGVSWLTKATLKTKTALLLTAWLSVGSVVALATVSDNTARSPTPLLESMTVQSQHCTLPAPLEHVAMNAQDDQLIIEEVVIAVPRTSATTPGPISADAQKIADVVLRVAPHATSESMRHSSVGARNTAPRPLAVMM